mmetsp:Transcript_144116/g.461383  ORF Transcript_144116/g.461383 Transcript_144116/m.461383 type:complete len:253 (-) Transcript_144116:52-810(-)
MTPRDMAQAPLGCLGEGLIATHLLHLELALTAQPSELELHVLPPDAAERVPLSSAHEVRRELLEGLACAAGSGPVGVDDDVGAPVELREDGIQRPEHQKVSIHVNSSVVIEHSRPRKVGFRGGIWQSKKFPGGIWDERPDVGLVDEDYLCALRRVLLPRLDIQRNKRVGATRVVPVGEDFVLRRLEYLQLDLGHHLFVRRGCRPYGLLTQLCEHDLPNSEGRGWCQKEQYRPSEAPPCTPVFRGQDPGHSFM